jgi:hypothetical protein
VALGLEPEDEAGGGNMNVDLGGGGNVNWDTPPLEGVAGGEKPDLGLPVCVFPSFVGVKSPRRSNWPLPYEVTGGGGDDCGSGRESRCVVE